MSRQEFSDPFLFGPWPARGPRRPLGRFLIDLGIITPGHLAAALHLQRRHRLRLGDVLIAEGWARPADIRAALAQQLGMPQADLLRQPPDPRLPSPLPPPFWLRANLLPWRRIGTETLIACSDPEVFARHRPRLEAALGSVRPALADAALLERAIARRFAGPLAARASQRVAADHSCRNWAPMRRSTVGLLLLIALALLLLAPRAALLLAYGAAFVSLGLFLILRSTAALAHLLHRPPTPRLPAWGDTRPKVSVMVALFRETEIAGALLHRLSQLTYPKALLEVLLVLEEHDDTTRAALTRTRLPPWIRIVEVPAHGGLTTKPRALNYALDFCRGEIVGVWDAEDAPQPDQIERIATRFARAPARVICLQGALDFYNPRTNWRARCFTLEYASWFRIVLPGLARLNLVLPLGGTTHYFRRAALEALGGWDAHNVTEDADLGVRLYRAGYRAEMVGTTTYEEATCRPWSWVKQRSRWLKGFMVTYLVHMRAPRRLWSDLGPRRFLGVQAFFLGTLGQFLLAPLLWWMWALALRLPHPLAPLLTPETTRLLIGLMLGTEATGILLAMIAAARSGRAALSPWALAMPLYFPLGILAAYKALWELGLNPFYWDKTRHGQSRPDDPQAALEQEAEISGSATARARRRPAAGGS
ncbi:glycosyltransferase [Pseudodonghicola flavimaris]|uniref:Glycosyltransferase n=1 Tax=Pseudodonghicola flavimaris TaxID=3050036 RepID=A0ABT7F009_9RHOB|nr:glycosyltransferase [Pseudodonghicola flavimaris]MDK3017935.1 glycosyltransferase [Pseudodonghicola flavimaris]